MTRCRVYDSECINDAYCTANDACCAGDPDCKPPNGEGEPIALRSSSTAQEDPPPSVADQCNAETWSAFVWFVAIVTQTLPGLNVSGHGLQGEQRDMQGRKLTVYFGNETLRDGDLALHFSGLPHGDPMPRYAAAAVSILIVLVFAIYAIGGGGDRRMRLERDRRRAFDELVAVDAKLGSGAGDRASPPGPTSPHWWISGGYRAGTV